jgi:hypothetical protein
MQGSDLPWQVTTGFFMLRQLGLVDDWQIFLRLALPQSNGTGYHSLFNTIPPNTPL